MKTKTTEKVWRGVLLMYRNPELIVIMKQDKYCEDGFLAKHMPQKDMDCILRAASWAEAHERQSK